MHSTKLFDRVEREFAPPEKLAQLLDEECGRVRQFVDKQQPDEFRPIMAVFGVESVEGKQLKQYNTLLLLPDWDEDPQKTLLFMHGLGRKFATNTAVLPFFATIATGAYFKLHPQVKHGVPEEPDTECVTVLGVNYRGRHGKIAVGECVRNGDKITGLKPWIHFPIDKTLAPFQEAFFKGVCGGMEEQHRNKRAGHN